MDLLHSVIEKAAGGRHPLDVAFVEEEGEETPWRRPKPRAGKLAIPLPKSISLVLADRIYIAKDEMPQVLLNRIIRLAAFQNPEFYKTQALRLSVWDKPRIIGCAENFSRHVALPRGCRESLAELLSANGILALITDERSSGSPIDGEFIGTLRDEQNAALDTLVLAMPISWKGTLQQYAGRLHRLRVGPISPFSHLTDCSLVRIIPPP